MNETAALEILDPQTVLPIPPEVATCPYCNTPLTAQFEAWTQEGNGTWTATSINLDCETEPDIDSDEWEEWMRWHSEMPYVYLLPVEEKVKAWVSSKYRFDLK